MGPDYKLKFCDSNPRLLSIIPRPSHLSQKLPSHRLRVKRSLTTRQIPKDGTNFFFLKKTENKNSWQPEEEELAEEGRGEENNRELSLAILLSLRPDGLPCSPSLFPISPPHRLVGRRPWRQFLPLFFDPNPSRSLPFEVCFARSISAFSL